MHRLLPGRGIVARRLTDNFQFDFLSALRGFLLELNLPLGMSKALNHRAKLLSVTLGGTCGKCDGKHEATLVGFLQGDLFRFDWG